MGSAWMRSVLVSPDGSWRVPIPLEPSDNPVTLTFAYDIVVETIGGAAPDGSDVRLHVRRADERWAVAHASCVSGNEDNVSSALELDTGPDL